MECPDPDIYRDIPLPKPVRDKLCEKHFSWAFHVFKALLFYEFSFGDFGMKKFTTWGNLAGINFKKSYLLPENKKV
jgi:hypothetical protein